MRRIRSGILLFLVLASFGAASARAGDVRLRVRGARVITPQSAAAILRANGFPRAGSLRPLQEAYMQAGFVFASFDVHQEADSSYTVVVDEGQQARVARSHIGGASVRPAADLRRELGLERGAPFDPRRFATNVENVLREYDAAGYPFAQVWVDSLALHPDSATVDIGVYMVEGFRRDLHGVVVEGLKKTRPELAERIAGVKPGTPYSSEVLEDIYLRMVSSGVFRDVEFPTVRVASNGRGVDAVVKVDEPRQAHTFAAAVGYASAEGTQKRTLSGLVQLDLNNIGGTLKDFSAHWLGDGNGRTETHIHYRDRLFLGRRLGVGLRLEQVGQDTLYTWQSVGLDVQRGFGRVAGTLASVSAGVFGDRNVFSTGTLLRSFRARGRLGLDALWGSERRASYAKVGVAVSFARKSLTYREGATGPGNVRQMIYEATVESVVPAFGSLHYSLVGAAQTLESAEAAVPLSEQFTLGGARTVRGYRENQFHGRRIAYARNELRLGRVPEEGLYAFVDVGYVLQPQTLADGTTTEGGTGLRGFGFGVRSASPLGRIDLSFAVGEEISLQATKVHVLLEQSF